MSTAELLDEAAQQIEALAGSVPHGGHNGSIHKCGSVGRCRACNLRRLVEDLRRRAFDETRRA